MMSEKVVKRSAITITAILLLGSALVFSLRDDRSYVPGIAPPPIAAVVAASPVSGADTSDNRPNIQILRLSGRDDRARGKSRDGHRKSEAPPRISRDGALIFMEHETRFELATPTLATWRSTN
jgi:hypothetical protein